MTKVAGVDREFDAMITEQHPDERVAWTCDRGPEAGRGGHLPPARPTRPGSWSQIDFEPEGLVETAGDKLGVVEHRVKGDLERFKDFIEARGTESGGWRGEVR